MSAFTKELARTITRGPGRFLALLLITALGAGFYAGLRMTAPDMEVAIDDYFDKANVYDAEAFLNVVQAHSGAVVATKLLADLSGYTWPVTVVNNITVEQPQAEAAPAADGEG